MGIREIRRAKNISQKELANAIGVDVSVVSRYEGGKTIPPANRLKDIASYLGVSIDSLLKVTPEISVDYYVDGIESIAFESHPDPERAMAQRLLAYTRGRCELCGCEAPFFTKDGRPYLEVHYINPISKGGKETIDNLVVLCPNCNRRVQILKDSSDLNHLTEAAKKHTAAGL